MKILSPPLVCTMFLAMAAIAQQQSLGLKDTLAAAKLSSKEISEIITGVELSAYDTPDSWTDELRAKRVDLGANPGIALEGAKLLCGGTGNCQIFVLRKMDGHWISLFGDQQAPIGESFQFGPGITRGIKDLTVITNSSAESGQGVTYKFDGKAYRKK